VARPNLLFYAVHDSRSDPNFLARNPAELGTCKATHAAVQTMIKHILACLRWLLALLIALSSALEGNTAAGNDDTMIGQKYEIVGELYAHSVAEDLNSRVVSFIELVPLRMRGTEIISRNLVPTGSILTIVEKAPSRFFAFLYPYRYIVRVNTIDAPAGIPMYIDLSRGIEGKSTPLNPLIFKPLF
jgi:hypothetical protein